MAPIGPIIPADTCVYPSSGKYGQPIQICGKDADIKIGNAPICRHHFSVFETWHFQYSAREEQFERDYARQKEEEWAAAMRGFKATGPQIVYYLLRLSDGYIKIGTSKFLDNRLVALRREHGALEVLATHCGGYERENEMHGQFRYLRVLGTEFFRPAPELLQWIVSVRRERANVQTVMPGTVPLGRVLALARECEQQAA